MEGDDDLENARSVVDEDPEPQHRYDESGRVIRSRRRNRPSQRQRARARRRAEEAGAAASSGASGLRRRKRGRSPRAPSSSRPRRRRRGARGRGGEPTTPAAEEEGRRSRSRSPRLVHDESRIVAMEDRDMLDLSPPRRSAAFLLGGSRDLTPALGGSDVRITLHRPVGCRNRSPLPVDEADLPVDEADDGGSAAATQAVETGTDPAEPAPGADEVLEQPPERDGAALEELQKEEEQEADEENASATTFVGSLDEQGQVTPDLQQDEGDAMTVEG